MTTCMFAKPTLEENNQILVFNVHYSLNTVYFVQIIMQLHILKCIIISFNAKKYVLTCTVYQTNNDGKCQ